MREYPNYTMINFLISSAKNTFPLFDNAKEALEYLKILTNENFMYNNSFNYDAINYEQLIYIEQNFSDNQEVEEKLNKIKKQISDNFIFKNKYLQRISSPIIDLDQEKRICSVHSEIHLPEEYIKVFREKVKGAYNI